MCVGKKGAGKRINWVLGRWKKLQKVLLKISVLRKIALAALHITEKVLAKCGLNLNESSSSEPSEADAFFGLLNYKNNQYGKAAADKFYKYFNLHLTPHFANTLLN